MLTPEQAGEILAAIRTAEETAGDNSCRPGGQTLMDGRTQPPPRRRSRKDSFGAITTPR